jgi:hypothetical protein
MHKITAVHETRTLEDLIILTLFLRFIRWLRLEVSILVDVQDTLGNILEARLVKKKEKYIR